MPNDLDTAVSTLTVSRDANVTVPSPGPTTHLMYACSQGDLQRVKKILAHQPSSATARDRTLKSALHYSAGASVGEPAHCADLLVMAAPSLVDAPDEDGFTPMHLACISGNMQLVTFLLANGADVNALDGEKHSVVHWATVCGETGALNAVLAAGAKVSTPDVHGGYPLHYAAQMCGSEKDELGLQVLHILLTQPEVNVTVEDNDGRQPLLWAASAGSARAVLALVRAGAKVEAADKDGLTALHCAASRGHTDTLDTLLTLCGAAPDVIDTNGCTALHYSVTLGHADATALLLSHSADPNRQDRKGRSPAHCGCAKGQLETVRQLGAHAANLWLRNARGDLPLHEAAASGRRPLMRWLLDQRPSQVNARNNDGRCPLHLAALNDNADMCKILLDAGAQVNSVLRTSKNIFMTPLDCALQRGFRSTAKFLQLHGGVPANRLGTIRYGTEIPPSSSNIYIREDVTALAGSSSETDLEDTKPRRRTVRRRVPHRSDKKLAKNLSGSDQDDKIDEKILRKHDKDGDVSVLLRDGVGKSSRHLEKQKQNRDAKKMELKSDGKQFRKKKQIDLEHSLSESEMTSPTKIQGSKDRKEKLKSQEDFLDAEQEEKMSIKDLERKKHKNNIDKYEDEDKFGKEIQENKKRRRKKSVHEEDQKLSDAEIRTKTDKQDEEVSTSDQDSKKQKSRKSDVSAESDQKISDRERRKKKSERKRDKSKSDQLKQKKDSTDTDQERKIDDKETEDADAARKERLSDNEKEEIKEIIESKKLDEEILQKKEKSTKKERIKSAKRTKINSAESKKEKQNSSQNLAEVKHEENINETTKDELQIEDKKITEDGRESLQADQISLQSKLSEESPSKTIVVEASVHHPPKGLDQIDDSEEIKDLKENIPQVDKDIEKSQTDQIDETTESKADLASEAQLETEQHEDQKEAVKSKIEEQIPLDDKQEQDKLIIDDETKSQKAEELLQLSQTEADLAEKKLEDKQSEDKIEDKAEMKDQLTEEEKSETIAGETDKNASEIIAKSEGKTAEQKINEAELVDKKIDADKQKTSDEVAEDQTEAQNEQQKSEEVKQEDVKVKQELNIDLSLKKFEESAQMQELSTDIDENENIKPNDTEITSNELQQTKEHRKKSKSETKTDVSLSTSRENSSTESEKSLKKPKTEDQKEHKSFKILHDDIAFQILQDSVTKEPRKIKRKSSKKTLKDADRFDESATSSPEMLESTRVRSKSHNRENNRRKSPSTRANLDSHSVSLPALSENRRPESNLSAPNLSSVYSENDDENEVDDLSSESRKQRRMKKRGKLRVGSKSAGSGYESSNLIDSGFEPSPRSSRIPKRKVMSERGVNMTSVTQQIQSNIRRYHMERKIFQHLLDLKRLQIRSGQSNEALLVKRAIDTYNNSIASQVGGGRYTKKDFSYRSFEHFLYHSLRMLQKSPSDSLQGLPDTSDNPLLCTQSTHRCLHATHAYTGIPCAAYIPKMNHHTMPKIGFSSRSSSSFLPQINAKGKSVTLELCHGNDKQVISLPADRLDHNKRYYVTFTVKGQDAPSPTTDQPDTTTTHRHAKSV